MRPLRLGVNALYLLPGGVGGTEIYLRNLLSALARVDSENEYFVFTNRETEPALVPRASNFNLVRQEVNAVNRPARLMWEQVQLPRDVRRHGLDCLLNPGFTAPLFPGCPQVTVFHDLQHIRHPEHFRRLDLLAWRFFLYWAVRRSREIIAVSEATRTDVISYYGVPPDRVHTIPHGVENDFFEVAANGRAPERMILCVSTLHPHKNLDRLLRAFNRFRELRPEYRLVLAGMRGFYADEVDRLISDLKLADSVEVTGWLERPALVDLFRRAEFFVYPSTFEGFGMPVLEALAAGVPAACSAIEPLRAVAGDAALMFQPWDERAICAALLHLAGNPELRDLLSHKGRCRAAGQDWDGAARRTLTVVRKATHNG